MMELVRPAQVGTSQASSEITCRSAYIGKTTTTRYDVAEHLRTSQEMAVCLEEAND